MRKKGLWIIPTIVLVFCVIINAILNIKEIYIELIDFIVFIICLYGIVFIAPCFYVFIINSESYNKKKFIKSIFYAIICIVVNAIVMCPKSLLYYLGILQREYHDLDLLPMYIIIPIGIIIVGVCIILLSKIIKTKGRFYCLDKQDRD